MPSGETLEEAQRKVDEASDRMKEALTWARGEEGRRAEAIAALADSGHEESRLLIGHFKLWYALMRLNSPKFVEESRRMADHIEQYRQAGYVP